MAAAQTYPEQPRAAAGAPAAWPYWSETPEALFASLDTGAGGLSAEAAARRLAEVGANTIGESAALGPLRLLLRQFESPLVLILVFAAVVSLGLRQWLDASIILSIVAGSCLLSFLQEYRASAAMAELKQRLTLETRVVRDGKERSVPFAEVVPGDLLILSAGNLIPADGVVLEAQDFLVSEASMTGESFPVEKQPGAVDAGANPGNRRNVVYLGASVRSGTARVLAVETGARTAFGAIAARLAESEPETAFARGVRQFGYLLVRVMIAVVLFVLTVNLLANRPAVDSMLFAVALAVGLSPELLPAIVSVTLAAGARAMYARGVIVRRLEAIENLGSMEVLCTDKTGTLTTGQIVLEAALTPQGKPSRDVLELAFLNASLETGIANPLDAALVSAGSAAHLSVGGAVKIDEIPYDFARRRLTIVIQRKPDKRHLLITKGAFAKVAAICTHVDLGQGAVPLDPAARAALDRLFEDRSREGFRVLAVATRLVEARDHHSRDEERDMTFQGLLVFADPAKADAAETVKALAQRGIAVKVVSGDNRHVTRHLAEVVGIDANAMLTGEDIAAMTDEALSHRAPRSSLFVEIDPEQKQRIVRALQSGGLSVGYLGDGINDAPALKAADVGISVEGAADVARESADIVLLTPDLAVLRQGVEDGRRTFANTLKYVSITTSANFGNMISMALATPFLPFLPLSAKQILLNNFLSDLPSMAISTDNVDPQAIAWPQRWSIGGIQRFMVVFGLISSVFDLLTFAVLLLALNADEPLFQTGWFIASVLTEIAVVLVLRTRLPAWSSRPSAALVAATVAVGALALSLPFIPPVAALFGFVPLSPGLIALLLAIVAGYIAVTEAAKRAWSAAASSAAPKADLRR